jgi:probable selenium-dependent hydroxylase accessory protein YqeC
MSVHDLLGLRAGEKNIVSICGAGGKTSLMCLLAHESMHKGIAAAMMTTTHFQRLQGEYIVVLEGLSPDDCRTVWQQGKIVVTGRYLEKQGRFGPPPEQEIRFLLDHAGAVYIEADGSRYLPLKYPASWEPVLLPETTVTVAVAGLSALGRPVDEVFHRAGLARDELGFDDEVVSEALMARVLWAGYGKYAPVFLLNQADLPGGRERGEKTAALLRGLGAGRVAVASLRDYLTGEFTL